MNKICQWRLALQTVPQVLQTLGTYVQLGSTDWNKTTSRSVLLDRFGIKHFSYYME